MKSVTNKDQPPIRIVLAEDHAIVRQGFSALLNGQPDMEVCAETDSSATTLQALKDNRPDMLIMDLLLKGEDGVELIKQIQTQNLKLPILVISMQDEQVYAERCLRAGASGYIMKNQAAEEFVHAIRTVIAGEIYVSRAMQVRILHRFLEHSPGQTKSQEESLTNRELHVYQMVGAGMATGEIAKDMGISPKTVETHRENIKQKLGLKNARELTQAAMAWVNKHQSLPPEG